MKELKIDGKNVPTLFYGTAWKEERTRQLVETAITAGFYGIDTANQRRHYYEAAVGEALDFLYQQQKIQRSELFLQTKFTYVRGQDHRLPYDPQADYTTQVNQSFASSLEHLKTDYIDSYVLHGPSTGKGLNDADWQVWNAITAIYKSGKTKLLGVSNVNHDQLAAFIEHAEIKPHFVQNRCYAKSKWDRKIRDLCNEHSILYQGFSLLTANVRELSTPAVAEIAEHHNRTIPQIVFRFALQIGMIPLTGTCNETHMKEDLAIYDFSLSDKQVNTVENIAFSL